MAVSDEAINLEIDGHDVRVSSPHKVFFKKDGQTKLDLIKYYLSLGPQIMATMGGRPTMMQRFPDGASGKSFYQKRVPKNVPDWLQTTKVFTANGTESNALVIADMAHVAWAVNLGCLGFHPWAYQAAHPEAMDELRIDLDPTPGVTFEMVRNTAAKVKDYFDELGIASYPKTTGSKGIHIYVRLAPKWNAYLVRAAVVAMARDLEQRYPDLMTAAWWKEERGKRVFIDYNQNAPHKTVFGAWSVRARVGAQVSTPFAWDELESVHPDGFTISVVLDRVAQGIDPWANMNKSTQSIEPLLALAAADMRAGRMDAPWPPQYPKQPTEPPRVAPSRAKKTN